MERGEDFVGDFALHGDKVERSDANGSAGAHALRGDIEQLPVEIESFFGAEEVAGEHEGDEQLFADRQRVHLRDGQMHERARWAHNERGNARQPRGDGIGEGEAVERSDLGGAKIGEGQNDERILRGAVDGRLAKTLGEHGKKAGVALFGFGPGGGQVGRGVAGNDAGLDLQRLHDGLERLAHFGGGGIARARSFFKAAGDDALQFRRDAGNDTAQIFGVGELDGADGLKVFSIGTRKGMAAAGELEQR